MMLNLISSLGAFDTPAGNKVKITAVNAANYKVRVV